MTEPKIDIEQHIQMVREALGKATPGPWTQSALVGGYVITDYPSHDAVAVVIEYNENGTIYKRLTDKWRENRHLIANSPTWIKQSIEIIEQQQREIESLRSQLAQVKEDNFKLSQSSMSVTDKLFAQRDKAQTEAYDFKLRAQEAERERDELKKANTDLLHGLRWYASPGTYQVNVTGQWEPKLAIVSDAGKRARDLLAQYDTSTESAQ
ncbi:hypothetical protein PAECIP111893_02417 [Paenibacillus plantiphilus]|uniref:Uncharacterized protein n=1 Tax=Paenibacillus plantiphilus TaxID=2905650 RepID=A0ABM9C8R2_9BACL|nr:hypothetical protein [Paenibacillus plantiphilus]CAH1205784.1 hypothetical protein PAECIP111893_02417 [Paenibacillus plantiphilus]